MNIFFPLACWRLCMVNSGFFYFLFPFFPYQNPSLSKVSLQDNPLAQLGRGMGQPGFFSSSSSCAWLSSLRDEEVQGAALLL